MHGSNAENCVKSPGKERSMGTFPWGQSGLADPLPQESLTPQTIICVQRFIAALFKITKKWKQLKCLSMDEQINCGLSIE